MVVPDLNCTPPAEDAEDEMGDDDAGVQMDEDVGVQMDEDAGVQHAGIATVAFQKFSVSGGRKNQLNYRIQFDDMIISSFDHLMI